MQRMQASLAFCERHDFIAEGIGTAAPSCGHLPFSLTSELEKFQRTLWSLVVERPLRQPCIDRCQFALDFDPAHHLEADPIVARAKFTDVPRGTGFLHAELV